MNALRNDKIRAVICLQLGIAGLLFLILSPNLSFAGVCKNAAHDLRTSFEVTQGRGGIWGFMEKSSSLRGDSMVGFQIDGKLQRVIVLFEARCIKSNQGAKENFQKVESIISDARMIFNLRPGRDPVKKIMTRINGLHANLNKLIKELEA